MLLVMMMVTALGEHMAMARMGLGWGWLQGFVQG